MTRFRPREAFMPRFASGKTWTVMLMAMLSVAVIQQALQLVVPAVAAAQAQEENPVAPADAGAAPAPDAAAPPAGAPAEESAPKRQSLLAFFFNALGWRYTLAFLVISFTFVAFL